MIAEFDCKSARVDGDKSFGRVRVIWIDGRLMGFDHDGKVFDVEAEKPKRRQWHIRVWDAKTPAGNIAITESCWTCGGWFKMTIKSIDDLIAGR